MKKLLFISAILTGLIMTSCKKSNETDYASKWVGVYNNPTSVPNDGISTTASLNNIVINKVDASTLKIQVKALETNYLYTYTTLKNVSLNGATKANIDEMDNLTEGTGQYHVKGTITLDGTQVTLNATATKSGSTTESDVINLHFVGFLNQ